MSRDKELAVVRKLTPLLRRYDVGEGMLSDDNLKEIRSACASLLGLPLMIRIRALEFARSRAKDQQT